MQFLWKYVEDLVGKGLDNLVLAELFFYAILSIIPMALPLAILLASLMTFGSLGERFELLAIKAAGISLLRSMRPLIIIIAFISAGAFFFQNEAMPKINVKITSLMRSIKMKSPELDIPEASFYNDIENYNLYVKSKNKDTGMLYGVKIYDTSKGFNNMAVIVCDSAKIRMSSNKDYLLLSLFYGQQFSNFQKPGTANVSYRNDKFVPYGRENFSEKEIIIPFDATFSRMDESSLQSTQIAKNIKELQATVDSLTRDVDSMNIGDRRVVLAQVYQKPYNIINAKDTVAKKQEKNIKPLNPDSVLNTLDIEDLNTLYSNASSRASSNSSDLLFRAHAKLEAQRMIRHHNVAWHQKFTLSFACLIFFFIGAPLGAIIRKGGLGMPVVVSVILFIIYYIFDNVGRKMARDGVWEVWQGIWLSSIILFPLGVFLTYKAMNDSALFNTEAYGNFIRKVLRLKKKTEYTSDSFVDISEIPDLSTLNADPEVVKSFQAMSVDRLKEIARNHKQYNYNESMLQAVLSVLKDKNASFIDVTTKNIDHEKSKGLLKIFDISYLIATIAYLVFVGLLAGINNSTSFIIPAIVAGIFYAVFYIKAFLTYSDFYESIDKKTGRNGIGYMLLALFLNWMIYPLIRHQMKKDFNRINW